MAGWFRKEIKSVADLQGLSMRIPGLGVEVFARVGGTPQNIPGGEIFSALQSGVIDVAEWVGPYNDLAFGLHKVALHCYYPGWHEPGSTLECIVNKEAFDGLPEALQAVVADCCQGINIQMLSEYTARKQQALEKLKLEPGVKVLPLPTDVLAALRTAASAVLADVAASDPMAKEVYESPQKFQPSAKAWHEVSEKAFYAARR